MNNLDKFKTLHRLRSMNNLDRLRYSAISFYCSGILTGIAMSSFLNGNLFLAIYSIVSIVLLIFVFKLMKLNDKEYHEENYERFKNE